MDLRVHSCRQCWRLFAAVGFRLFSESGLCETIISYFAEMRTFSSALMEAHEKSRPMTDGFCAVKSVLEGNVAQLAEQLGGQYCAAGRAAHGVVGQGDEFVIENAVLA